MINIELNELLQKADCRYTLVVETAKRARQIVDGSQPLTSKVETNPVSQAVNEIREGKITYIRHAEGIK
jgi:DNA-directed RNA polymerase subunit omega